MLPCGGLVAVHPLHPSGIQMLSQQSYTGIQPFLLSTEIWQTLHKFWCIVLVRVLFQTDMDYCELHAVIVTRTVYTSQTLLFHCSSARYPQLDSNQYFHHWDLQLPSSLDLQHTEIQAKKDLRSITHTLQIYSLHKGQCF